MTNIYNNTGLKINVRKTEIPHITLKFDVRRRQDKSVASSNLGSILSSSCNINDKAQNRIQLASFVFGRLRTESSAAQSYNVQNTFVSRLKIIQRQFRRVSHVYEGRLLRTLLYGELASGQLSVGGQKEHLKGHLKATLKAYNVPSNNFEQLTADRSTWRSTTHATLKTFEAQRIRSREEQHRRRHELLNQGPLPPGVGT